MIMQIWKSFFSLPLWVQIWVGLILVPANFCSLYFYQEPHGLLIAFLASIGIILNLPVMMLNRGFSKAMALPHIVPWTILVALLLFWRPEASGTFNIYLSVILVVDAISLVFDFPDALKWLGGDRKIAGDN